MIADVRKTGNVRIATTLDIYTHVVDASHRRAIEAVEHQLFPTVPKSSFGVRCGHRSPMMFTPRANKVFIVAGGNATSAEYPGNRPAQRLTLDEWLGDD